MDQQQIMVGGVLATTTLMLENTYIGYLDLDEFFRTAVV